MSVFIEWNFFNGIISMTKSRCLLTNLTCLNFLWLRNLEMSLLKGGIPRSHIWGYLKYVSKLLQNVTKLNNIKFKSFGNYILYAEIKKQTWLQLFCHTVHISIICPLKSILVEKNLMCFSSI